MRKVKALVVDMTSHLALSRNFVAAIIEARTLGTQVIVIEEVQDPAALKRVNELALIKAAGTLDTIDFECLVCTRKNSSVIFGLGPKKPDRVPVKMAPVMPPKPVKIHCIRGRSFHKS